MCLEGVVNLSEFQFCDSKGNIITTFIRSGSLEKDLEIQRFMGLWGSGLTVQRGEG